MSFVPLGSPIVDQKLKKKKNSGNFQKAKLEFATQLFTEFTLY